MSSRCQAARRRGAGAWLLVVLLAAVRLAAAAATEPLPTLNIELRETSVSGISSGGFMAVQFAVAHSSIVRGAGIIAAGPYDCARGEVLRATTRCSCTLDLPGQSCAVGPASTEVDSLVAETRRLARGGLIDDPANLARQRFFLVAGGQDGTVPAAVVDQLRDYLGRFVAPGGIALRRVEHAGHAMPTESYGNPCPVTASPYLNRCRFAAAEALLEWIYGPPAARRSGAPDGRLIRFDQTPFVAGTSFRWLTGLDDTGWVYVPAACARGQSCRLHIALHGCRQGQSWIPLQPPAEGSLQFGTTFVEHAGYNGWADANRIVVLYPQAVSIPLVNPNGCWDWWGYTGEHYADRQGVQIRALRAMVDRLGGGR